MTRLTCRYGGGDGTLKRNRAAFAALALVILLMVPAPASASGSSLFGRFWDSLVESVVERTRDQNQTIGQFLEDAEEFFLTTTQDVTQQPALRDVMGAMQYVGMFLLAWCFVISLSELTTASLWGGGQSFGQWFWRFLVATFMTFAALPYYSLWIRLFNFLVRGLREYLDKHWSYSTTGDFYETLVGVIPLANELLFILFAAVFLIICILLWFLIGGIRPAELAVHTILAPLTWPLYMIPSLEDIPKTAFRGFLGVNAVLLITVAMMRMAVRWALNGGAATSLLNFVPSIALLGMCLFLPAVVRRIVGQGHSGLGALTTAFAVAKGLMLLRDVHTVADAVARPPQAQNVPPTGQAPVSGSNLPAPVPVAGHQGGWSPGSRQLVASPGRSVQDPWSDPGNWATNGPPPGWWDEAGSSQANAARFTMATGLKMAHEIIDMVEVLPGKFSPFDPSATHGERGSATGVSAGEGDHPDPKGEQ